MYLRDAATAAVVVSCLLLMIADHPVKACNCPDITDKQRFCGAKELVELTILEEKETDSDQFFQYKVRIDTVYKSTKGLTAQAEIDFQTPSVSELCARHLSTGRQYMLEVFYLNGVLSANGCSWMKRGDSAKPYVNMFLNGHIQNMCRETETMIE